MNDHIQSLHDRLSHAGTDSQTVNITHIIWAYTNDIMLSYVLGDNLGFLKSQDFQALHDATRAFGAIDIATVLRTMPPVKALFELLPWMRQFSPFSWIDNVGIMLRLGQTLALQVPADTS